ncbi:PUS4_2 [Sanghuangporus weigelae]
MLYWEGILNNKKYRTMCLLGCETNNSMYVCSDSEFEGAHVRTAPYKFRGYVHILLSFSVSIMAGILLYEYAREGIPAFLVHNSGPQDIVRSIELTHWIPDKEREKLEKAPRDVELTPYTVIKDEPESISAEYPAGASKSANSPSNGPGEKES